MKIDSKLTGLGMPIDRSYEYGCIGLDIIDPPTIISVIGDAFTEDLRRHKQRISNSCLASGNGRIMSKKVDKNCLTK